MGPLARMPLSVVSEVMHQIKGDGKQSAIFRLLQSIAELCNVSSRDETERSDTSNEDGSSDNKRQKVGM